MTTNIHKKECVVKNNFNLIVTTPKPMTEINILMQNLYPNKCSKTNMSHKYPPKTYILEKNKNCETCSACSKKDLSNFAKLPKYTYKIQTGINKNTVKNSGYYWQSKVL